MTRHGFQYVVLRCVPRVDREEFVNVGVLLYSQSADYLCAGSRVQEARLLAFAPELDLDATRSALAAIEAVCCSRADPSGADPSGGDPSGADLGSGADPAGRAARVGGADPAGRGGISLGQRFGWLAAPRSTVVQPGPIHGGVTEDPAWQLQHLLRTLVG